MAYVFGSIWDRFNRNALNDLSKNVETQGKSIQDLVAEGQLTPEEYAQLITVINGLVKKGQVTVRDIDVNKGKIDLSMLDETVKSAMSGDTAILSEVANGAITSPKIYPKAVSADKTDFLFVGRNLFDKDAAYDDYSLSNVTGELVSNANQVASDFIPVIPGSEIYKNKTGSIIEYDGDRNRIFGIGGGATAGSYTLRSDTYYIRVGMASVDKDEYQVEYGTTGSPYEEYQLKFSDKAEVDKLSESTKKSLLTSITDSIFSGSNLKLSYGTISASSLEVISTNTTSSAYISPSPYLLKKGESIELLDTANYEMAMADEDINYFIDGWNSTKYTASRDILFGAMFRRKDSSSIDLTELSNNILYKSNDRAVKAYELNGSGGNLTKYVTLNGSDSNDGDSANGGYATLQKALDEGANTVYIERGEYKQRVSNANQDELTILPLDDMEYTTADAPLQKIVFSGGEKLSNFTSYETIFRIPFTDAVPNFKEYFIDKTLPKSTGGNRSTYNVALWEVIDQEEFDYLLEPMLSINEVENTEGSFYWDGDYIYINPSNIENDFIIPKMTVGLNLEGIKKLRMKDVVADYFIRHPLNLDRIKDLDLQNCEANHAVYTDGFSLDHTNGTLTYCRAIKNRNDGFNMHFYGDTTLINCSGLFNYDDGVSHHEQCTGTIVGGVWKGNNKGGISPATQAKVNTYNATLERNGFGLYNSNAGNNNISQGNLYIDNDVAIYNGGNEGLRSINDTFSGNTQKITGDSSVQEY